MILRTIVGTNLPVPMDVSASVLKGQGAQIAVEIEDEDGAQRISSATVGVSNNQGVADFLINRTDRLNVEMRVDNDVLFVGFVAPSVNSYNQHNRIFSLSMLQKEADTIKRLESLDLPDILSGLAWVQKDIANEISTFTGFTTRWFTSLNGLIGRVATLTGLTFSPMSQFTNIFIGGFPVLEPGPASLRLPDWTFYELISNISKTYNCLFKFGSGAIELVPKVSLISGTLQSVLSLQSIKGSVNSELASVGYDIIDFVWSGPFARGNYPPYAAAYVKTRTGVLSTKKEITSDFGVAVLDDRPDWPSFRAYISPGNILTNFLIYSTGNGTDQSAPIKAIDVVNGYWDVELHGTDRITGTYLIKNMTAANLQLLCNAFYTRFTGVEELGQHFITKAEVLWQERLARITGVKYAYPS